MRQKFILVFFAFFSSVFVFLFLVGEIYSDEYYKEKSVDNEIYLRYSDIEPQIKFYNLKYKKPRQIIIGSSRVLTFDSEIYNSNEFYNLGRTVYSINDLEHVINNLDLNTLDSVNIGLDPYFFNKNYLKNYNSVHDFKGQKILSRMSYAARKLIIDILKMNFQHLKFDKWKIGLNYYINQGGIDKDGSRIYGNVKINFYETNSRIKNYGDKFESFLINDFDFESLEKLDKLIAILKSKNIHSSFFIPPISKKSLNYFKNNREIDLNITIGDTLSLFFLQRNIPFYDFTEIAGENDEKYFYDAIHFDKKFASQIFKIMNE